VGHRLFLEALAHTPGGQRWRSRRTASLMPIGRNRPYVWTAGRTAAKFPSGHVGRVVPALPTAARQLPISLAFRIASRHSSANYSRPSIRSYNEWRKWPVFCGAIVHLIHMWAEKHNWPLAAWCRKVDQRAGVPREPSITVVLTPWLTQRPAHPITTAGELRIFKSPLRRVYPPAALAHKI
jgi:hypothetical protein